MSSTTDSIYRNGRYLQAHPTWHEEDSPWKAEQVALMLERNGLEPSQICEVGCGAGRVLVSLRDRLPASVHFFGYEISPHAYALTQDIDEDRIQFFLADLLDESLTYELVCCLDVVEHVEDYLGFLRRLRPRGRLKLFHLPLEITVERLLRTNGFMKVRQRFGHLHHFTRQSALASLEDTGYRVIDWFYTPSELVLPPKSLGQRLARIPRRFVYLLHKGLAARTTGGVSLMVLAE